MHVLPGFRVLAVFLCSQVGSCWETYPNLKISPRLKRRTTPRELILYTHSYLMQIVDGLFKAVRAVEGSAPSLRSR